MRWSVRSFEETGCFAGSALRPVLLGLFLLSLVFALSTNAFAWIFRFFSLTFVLLLHCSIPQLPEINRTPERVRILALLDSADAVAHAY
jgi:hypothetical protein